MRARRYVVFVVAGVLGIFGVGLLSLQYGWPAMVAATLSAQNGDGLSFAFEYCREDSSEIPDSAPTVTWVNARTVQISGIAESNCSTSWIVGDYSLTGDTITLGYQAILSGYALCDCKHRVSYRIEGLSKKDYRIDLRAGPAISAVFWWGSPWMLCGLAVLLLSLVSSGVLLVLRERRNANVLDAKPIFGSARSESGFVLLLLTIVATISTVFWYQAVSAQQAALVNALTIERLGATHGKVEADQDFAAGAPRWYRFRYTANIPEDKADRRVTTVDGGGYPAAYMHLRAFVDAYNSRMDDLFERKRRGAAKRR